MVPSRRTLAIAEAASCSSIDRPFTPGTSSNRLLLMRIDGSTPSRSSRASEYKDFSSVDRSTLIAISAAVLEARAESQLIGRLSSAPRLVAMTDS